jgi:hypothetical protein
VLQMIALELAAPPALLDWQCSSMDESPRGAVQSPPMSPRLGQPRRGPRTVPKALLTPGAAAGGDVAADPAFRKAAQSVQQYLHARLPRIRGLDTIAAFAELCASLRSSTERRCAVGLTPRSFICRLRPAVAHPHKTEDIVILPGMRRQISSILHSLHFADVRHAAFPCKCVHAAHARTRLGRLSGCTHACRCSVARRGKCCRGWTAAGARSARTL